MPDHEKEYLLEEITSKLGKEEFSFYNSSFDKLGINLISELFSELQHRIRLGEIDNPKGYFTTMINNELIKLPDTSKMAMSTYCESTQITLFESLLPLKAADKISSNTMLAKYSLDYIPWATALIPEFFTLSSVKDKSDVVIARFPTLDGAKIEVPLHRGRYSPTDKAYGILSVFHARVLAGLETLWVEQGCRYHQYEGGSQRCYCEVSLRKLGKILGFKKAGGSMAKMLRNAITDLKAFPYYIDVSQLNLKNNVKGFGFTLLESVKLIEKSSDFLMYVEFCDPLSRQLIARRSVSRPKFLLTVKSELAFKLELYLEPRLVKFGSYRKALKTLIEDLQLPKYGWHSRKSIRHKFFNKALTYLDNKNLRSGKLRVWLETSEDDYVLNARLERFDNKQPVLIKDIP